MACDTMDEHVFVYFKYLPGSSDTCVLFLSRRDLCISVSHLYTLGFHHLVSQLYHLQNGTLSAHTTWSLFDGELIK